MIYKRKDLRGQKAQVDESRRREHEFLPTHIASRIYDDARNKPGREHKFLPTHIVSRIYDDARNKPGRKSHKKDNFCTGLILF